LKVLYLLRRGCVLLLLDTNQLELLTQFGSKPIEVVTGNIETATTRRAVERECGDDDVGTGSQSRSETGHVGTAVHRFGQEVEDRAVVPKSVLARRREPGDVGADQRDALCLGTQSRTDVLDGGVGNVQDGQIPEASLEQAIDERRCTTPDVDDRIVETDPGGFDEGERQSRLGLIPAHLAR